MLYTLIIVVILIIALILGMYFSSYQTINEKLALKKKYLRSQSVLFKGPKIKSRISYSFGTIACLLLVFIIFNDPSINVPFKRVASAEAFNETIDALVLKEEDESFFFKEALNAAKEVNPKVLQYQKVISEKNYVYIANQNNLIKVSKNDLTNNAQEIVIEDNFYQYDDSIEINGLLSYQNKILTYGKYLNESFYLESIINIHNKDTLKLEKQIIVKGKIEDIKIQWKYLYLITVNGINKNEDYVGKIFSLKFNKQVKYPKINYKNIYYIPDNNIKYVLGIAKIDLKSYKYTTNSLLVSDYFLAANNRYAYISVSIENKDKQNSALSSYIVQYDFYRMKINNSNKIEGHIYNDFIFLDNGNFIVATVLSENNQNVYRIYTYDRLFYLKQIDIMNSPKNSLLVQKDDYFYVVNLDSRLVYLSQDDQKGLNIVSDRVSLNGLLEFHKLLYDKIIHFNITKEQINVTMFRPKDRQILYNQNFDISSNNVILFENYQYQGQKYNILNIQTQINDSYVYYIVLCIDDTIYNDYVLIKSPISFNHISHFFIDDYFIVLRDNIISLYHSERFDSETKIIIP